MKSKRPDTLPKRLPLARALAWILLSTLGISGSSFLALLYFQHIKDARRHDPKYQIVAIVQTSKDKEGLKTTYLAELLDLSVDSRTNLFAFDAKQGRMKLLHSPVIKDATVKKIRPGTIWVDYTLRKPLAFLGDYTNTAIDAEGVAFPFDPFFTPKTLPEIYLGIAEENPPVVKGQYPWSENLQGKKLSLAFSLLQAAAQLFHNASTTVSSIDVSRAFSTSYGQRQIVMVLHHQVERIHQGVPSLSTYPMVLRLETDTYRQQLDNFVTLHGYLSQREMGPLGSKSDRDESMVVDLRLADMAFISTSRI